MAACSSERMFFELMNSLMKPFDRKPSDFSLGSFSVSDSSIFSFENSLR